MNLFKSQVNATCGILLKVVFFSAISLNAQTVKRSTGYYWSNNEWVYVTQTVYKYNLNSTIDTIKRYTHDQFSGNSWSLYSYSTYDYYGSGTSMVLNDYYMNSVTEAFESKNKTTVTYTTGGKELQVIYSSKNGSSFENSMRYDYFYNSKMFLTQVKVFSWDVNWVNDRLYAFSNDAAGNPTSYIYQALNDSTNNWDNVSRGTFVYSGGNMVSETLETWELSGWYPNTQTTYTFTSGSPAKMKSALVKSYQNNSWVNDSQGDYVYTPTSLVNTVQNWQVATSSWTNLRRTVDEYVLEPTSIAEVKIQEIRLYPSPARDFVTLSGLGNVHQIQVFDEKGTLLRSQAVFGSMTRLDVSTLEPGVYFIRAEGQGVKRFIKE